MLNSSGSMKLSALDMAMNTSSLTRAGMPCRFIHSVTLIPSCASTYACPPTMAGSNPIANLIFSSQVSISLLRRMAKTPLSGEGSHSGKSNRENAPGTSRDAKIIECSFHCRRSSMPSSLNRFWTLG